MTSAPNVTAEQLTHALGEAVIGRWGSLPHEVQHQIFEDAIKSGGGSIRSQLATFLHDKHPRTWDPLGRLGETTEPDSLGG